ncbi:MAG: sulfite exporter TauE/SafE family protein [Acidimicrobiales bacterium]
MLWDVIAIILGLGVGLSLGALGGGGSTLAVPILVFVAGMATQQATAASLLVVGVAAAIGAWRHHGNGTVRLGAGLAFGAAGIVGARVGTTLNHSLNEHVLLLAFSGLVLFVAARMYRSADPAPAGPVPAGPAISPDHPAVAGAAVPAGGEPVGPVAVATAAPPQRGLELSFASMAKLAAAATLVGLLTGLFGVGGGFAIVPALTLLLGFSTKEAIGTSLVVIAMNAAIALTMRIGTVAIDWSVVLPFLATVVVGVLLGSRLARTMDAARLTRAFAVMLALVAAYTAVRTVLAA